MVNVRARRTKVVPKTNLTIIREADLPEYDTDSAALDAAKDDLDPNSGVQKIKTGVEEHEEKARDLPMSP